MDKTEVGLRQIVETYYRQRDLTQPDATQALLFLVSEVGELADAHVESQAEWVRNNDRERGVEDEIGDVLMMLTVFAATQGVDPVDAMLAKFQRKGFAWQENNSTNE
jgi:NTP pyrophosphatase (non-canonical NTP hydrolase)